MLNDHLGQDLLLRYICRLLLSNDLYQLYVAHYDTTNKFNEFRTGINASILVYSILTFFNKIIPYFDGKLRHSLRTKKILGPRAIDDSRKLYNSNQFKIIF